MSNSLLTYYQAVDTIRRIIQPLSRTERVPLFEAAGYFIAQPVLAPFPNPRFDNSAVDGYAIGLEKDAQAGSRLKVVGVSAAGSGFSAALAAGETIRIFTGAPTPPETYGIVMQEDVERTGDEIELLDSVKPGDFIRRQGAEFPQEFQLAARGALIDAGTAVQLAFAGEIYPKVYSPPRVLIMTSGDELVDPADVPGVSQIRDTNSVMLSYLVSNAVPSKPTAMRIADDRAGLSAAISEAAETYDMILISGGASVGERDFIGSVIAELGTIHFHGVAIRPGKPILFGSIGSCLVFGLPGNPASAFVCFEIFVREALWHLAGGSSRKRLWNEARAGFGHKGCGREDFVRVRVIDDALVEAGEQGSFGIGSLANADGLARFPGERDTPVGERCLFCRLK